MLKTDVNIVVVGKLQAEVFDFEQVDMTEDFLQEHFASCLLLHAHDAHRPMSTRNRMRHQFNANRDALHIGPCESYFFRSNRISNRIGRIYHASRNTA